MRSDRSNSGEMEERHFPSWNKTCYRGLSSALGVVSGSSNAINHHAMNCQSLPARWSPKQHNRHPRDTAKTQPSTFQYLQLDHRRLSSPGDQRRDSAQCHVKATRMWNHPGILCTHARELSKNTKTLFCWIHWLLTQFTCMPPRQQQHGHEASHLSDPFPSLPPAITSQHCWRPSQPLTLFYLSFWTSP